MKYVFKNTINIALASILDAAGYLLFLPFRRSKGAQPTLTRSILIIRLDHLGDVLLSLGIPKALKENLPGCKVTFLTSSWAAPLLANNPFVDEVLVFDAPWFLRRGY